MIIKDKIIPLLGQGKTPKMAVSDANWHRDYTRAAMAMGQANSCAKSCVEASDRPAGGKNAACKPGWIETIPIGQILFSQAGWANILQRSVRSDSICWVF